MYSLGMICYFIVFGELPFEPQLDIVDLKVRIKNFRFDTEGMIEKHQAMKLKPIDRRIFHLMDALYNQIMMLDPQRRQWRRR